MGGLPDDDKVKLKKLYSFAIDLKCDIASLHFLTPMPGTDLHHDMTQEGLIKVMDYSKYSWFTPVMATRHMTIEELDRYWSPKILLVNFHNPLTKIKRMFTGDPENRRIMRIGALMTVRYLVSLFLMRFRKPGEKFRSFIQPRWYHT